jgi:signal transduction histidine kinase
MDKVRRKIWWIAAPAVLAALLFQLFWLRQTYRSQQEAFMATATEAFNKAYDNAIINTAKMLSGETSQKKKGYSVYASINIDDSLQNSTVPKKRSQISVRPNAVAKLLSDTADGEINLDTTFKQQHSLGESLMFAHFVSSIFSSFTDLKPDIDTVTRLYRAELDKKHIPLPFTILLNSKDIDTVNSKPTLLINPSMNNPDKLIGVQFSGITPYLLKKMSSAIVLSIFIAFLITGCIWTLWRIILRQEKLEHMKRGFISHVTHELKTPVSILRATNEALLSFQGMYDADKTVRYLRHSKTELDRLQDLVDKIMQVTRGEEEQHTLSATPLTIEVLITQCVGRFAHLPGVNIEVAYAIQHADIRTDADAFSTILTNLLDNAVKYNDKSRKEIHVQVKELPAYYSFSVKDNGNGIEKQHFPFLYDKFYRIVQGDRLDNKGYGLGLSHVKALLQQLNGSVSVSSVPGAGSTFTFQLPKI